MYPLYRSDPSALFYTNSINCSLYVENGNAVVWLSEDMTDAQKADLSAFLSVTARTVRANRPLPLPGYAQTMGSVYGGCKAERFTAQTTENLRECAAVWERVFPEAFSGEAGQVRYADCSHRIRHGMSRAFCLDQKVALLVFCEEAGCAVVDQLAVLPEHRNKGLASALLCHVSAALHPENGFLFESRDEASDRFYEKSGFVRVGEWHEASLTACQ